MSIQKLKNQVIVRNEKFIDVASDDILGPYTIVLYIAIADRWISDLSQSLPYEKSAGIFEKIFNPDFVKDEIERGPEFVVDTTKADYVWLPFRFDGKMAYLDWKDEWRIEDYE